MQKSGKKFHVIHAEFDPNANVTDAVLADPIKAKEIAFAQTRDGDAIIWGRYTFGRFYGEDLSSDRMISKLKQWSKINKQNRMYNDNLSLIYSGHTPVLKPLQFYGQINIDTMAYSIFSTVRDGRKPNRNHGLTVVNPETSECWLSNHEGVRLNKIVTMPNTEDTDDAAGSK